MQPLVSVYCTAYNHEKYIQMALDGFVSQKTDFPFEVFVHDDASTDHTADIIRDYAEKYPDIIKPILQKENQYSKGLSIGNTFIYPLMKGKYVAACEGDDYWCDDRKLQRQVDWLEKHPDYSFCVHNTRMIDCVTGEERLINNSKEDRDISTEEIIQWKGHLFHTSSYMFRAEFVETPEAFSVKNIGDYPRAVYLATCGKVRYLGDVMSVYRYMVSGSWSSKMYQSADNTNRRIEHYQDRIKMLKRVDECTAGKYSACIQEVIRRNEFNILYLENDIKTIRKEYLEYYRQLSAKNRLYANMQYYCPGLLKLYSKLKKHY